MHSLTNTVHKETQTKKQQQPILFYMLESLDKLNNFIQGSNPLDANGNYPLPCKAELFTNCASTEDLLLIYGPNTEVIDVLVFQKRARQVDDIRFFLTIIEHEDCFIVLIDGERTPYVFHQLSFEDNQERSWYKSKGDQGILGSLSISYQHGEYEVKIGSSAATQEVYKATTQVGFVKLVSLSQQTREYRYPGMYPDLTPDMQDVYMYQQHESVQHLD